MFLHPTPRRPGSPPLRRGLVQRTWRLLQHPFRQRHLAVTAVLALGLSLGLSVALSLSLMPTPAWAGRDDGQRALQARQDGRVLPLEQLIRQVADVIPGRLLQAELEDDDGLLVYELRWQLADGRRLELEIDARDGRWLQLKGPRLETVFRRPAAASPAPAATRPAPIPAAPPR